MGTADHCIGGDQIIVFGALADRAVQVPQERGLMSAVAVPTDEVQHHIQPFLHIAVPRKDRIFDGGQCGVAVCRKFVGRRVVPVKDVDLFLSVIKTVGKVIEQIAVAVVESVSCVGRVVFFRGFVARVGFAGRTRRGGAPDTAPAGVSAYAKEFSWIASFLLSVPL